MEVRDEIKGRFQDNLGRVRRMIETYESSSGAGKGRRSVRQTDLLRGAVVLLHASLEDLLRSLCEWKVPAASPDAFSEIPLLGTRGKTRFGLAELAVFRGQTVEDVIRQSVLECLGKSSFSHPGEVKAVLQTLGVVSDSVGRHASALAAMMARRHWIAHRADRNPSTGPGHHSARSLASSTVGRWADVVERLGNDILSSI
jgi:hypothetical protein